ncbi:NAD(P)-binding oxidoreductase [Pediococcus siamensis]|uniref:NAD(P)-binding oxidoreductase n=1 Tax=Pediococcus siamensis TaxID=381829 RepID=UPI0039A0BCE1
MKRILVMGVNSKIGQAFYKMCQSEAIPEVQFTFIEEKTQISVASDQVHAVDLQDVSQLAPYLQVADILIINVSGWDVDYVLDAVMDAIEENGIQLEKIIFCSAAGVNGEFPVAQITAVSHDREEFIKQQQYAGKLVDESEIPYTILRPTPLTDTDETTYQLVKEGNSMAQAKKVSPQAVAQVLMMVMQSDHFKNASLGICG